MATISASLLAEVKNYLDITWTDTDADAKLAGQISRGIAYICAKTGLQASDFEGTDACERGKELLFNYVLYDRSGAVNEFKKNYQSDIVGLRALWEVKNATDTES